MSNGFRPKRKEKFEQWPPSHRLLMGGMLGLLFLEGAVIVSRFGAIHILILLILWIISFPVIHFSLCRKCYNCGKRCAIPGEGELANLLFEKREGPPGLFNWLGTALSYVIRLGYPAAFLILYPERYSTTMAVIYELTFIMFLLLDARVIGCPNCMNKNCPLNPDYVR